MAWQIIKQVFRCMEISRREHKKADRWTTAEATIPRVSPSRFTRKYRSLSDKGKTALSHIASKCQHTHKNGSSNTPSTNHKSDFETFQDAFLSMSGLLPQDDSEQNAPLYRDVLQVLTDHATLHTTGQLIQHSGAHSQIQQLRHLINSMQQLVDLLQPAGPTDSPISESPLQSSFEGSLYGQTLELDIFTVPTSLPNLPNITIQNDIHETGTRTVLAFIVTMVMVIVGLVLHYL